MKNDAWKLMNRLERDDVEFETEEKELYHQFNLDPEEVEKEYLETVSLEYNGDFVETSNLEGETESYSIVIKSDLKPSEQSPDREERTSYA